MYGYWIKLLELELPLKKSKFELPITIVISF